MTFPCNPRTWRIYKSGLWEPLGHNVHRQLHTISHSEPILVTRRIALIVIYSRSRIPPPLWDLNLGKLCYLVPVNRPPSPTSLNTHREDPSMAYSSAIPRQLVSLWEHQVYLNWFWQTELWSVATIFEVLKRKHKKLTCIMYHLFSFLMAYKISILCLRSLCLQVRLHVWLYHL